MALTVVPLLGLYLPDGLNIPFGNDLTFQEIPKALLNDPAIKESRTINQYQLSHAKYAFVAEYDGPSMDSPVNDIDIHKQRVDAARIANLALWITHPTIARFAVAFHASSSGLLRDAEYQPTIWCHEDDNGVLTEQNIRDAAVLYAAIRTVSPANAVWTAMRMIWSALTTPVPDIRYPFFWVALEALFGARDAQGEITYRLSQRIAFFDIFRSQIRLQNCQGLLCCSLEDHAWTPRWR